MRAENELLRTQLTSVAAKFEEVEALLQGRVNDAVTELQQQYTQRHEEMAAAIAAAQSLQAEAEAATADALAEVWVVTLSPL